MNERLTYWKNKLQHPPSNQKVRVALHNNRIVDFACCLIGDDPVDGTLLDNLHVGSEIRGSGIGKLLLNDAVSGWLENNHENKFYCWVLKQNFQARYFYEKMGAINKEVIPLENPDGITSSMTCRYVWLNVDLILRYAQFFNLIITI